MLQVVVVCVFPIVKVVYVEDLMDLFSNALKDKFCVCNTKVMFCCVLTLFVHAGFCFWSSE